MEISQKRYPYIESLPRYGKSRLGLTWNFGFYWQERRTKFGVGSPLGLVWLISEALKQLSFNFVPTGSLAVKNDLKATITSICRCGIAGRFFGPIDGPPIMLASKHAFHTHDRMDITQKVQQFVSVKDVVYVKNPTAGVVARPIVLETERVAFPR